ncbi:S41 family peptidase [Flavobacterium selenitireducens]|uniref:S41 family peptidase n=1 Tax=Flavobacterium selenitireducens TaxID=2722704 RepID=UPI00168A5634|nr:S41 family peptidase [Flavobacterium selenitireducens]MBD3581667.1 hypothetical protein [Flavobacterium selenitireducens]
MKKLLLFNLLLTSFFATAQMPDSVRVSIDSALVVMQKNSLYSKNVDWAKVRSEVFSAAKNATNSIEAFPALKIAFDALGDKHANYWYYGQNYMLPNPELNARQSDSLKAKWKKGQVFGKEMIGEIAYLNVPAMPVNKQKDIDQYANWMRNAVAELAAKNPRGWIVDLRMNTGGNIRPMLAGLSPFFSDGIFGHYIDSNGKLLGKYEFKNGDFIMDGQNTASVTKQIASLSKSKVAVLMGAGTGSSGEGVAVTFQQRPNTKSFGEKTAGLANTTDGFVFNNQQCYFLISVGYLADGKKKILPESVKPDAIIKGAESYFDLKKDATVQAALKWLK